MIAAVKIFSFMLQRHLFNLRTLDYKSKQFDFLHLSVADIPLIADSVAMIY